MGEQDVDVAGLVVREFEVADPCARVEHELPAVGERDLDAGGVAAVAHGVGPRAGDRAARAPDLDAHQPAASVSQKIAIAPRSPWFPTMGNALTSIRRSSPRSERTVK